MTSSSAALHVIANGAETLGYIAIDSTVAGRARGGLRLIQDVTAEEIRSAARAMTLKYGFLGLPQGGAKAGVVGPAEGTPAERRESLHRFAEGARVHLERGTYVPDADMGTTTADIREMVRSIGISVGPREWRSTRSGDHTALSCVVTARVVAASIGLPLEGARVAIEGFGKVGSALGRLLGPHGARVVAVSTSQGAIYDSGGIDVDRVGRVAAAVGSRFVTEEPGRIEREALLELPVDILFPCARFHSIDVHNVDRVQARLVASGANDAVSPAAEARLAARGIACPPDFVSNCGGVLGGTLEFASVPFDRAARLVEDIVGDQVAQLVERAGRERRTLRSVAEAVALSRHAVARAMAESPTWQGRLVDLGLQAYRRGWIPGALVGRVAPRHLRARLG